MDVGVGVDICEIGCGVNRGGADSFSFVALIEGAGVVIRDGIGAVTEVEMETMNCSPFVMGIDER